MATVAETENKDTKPSKEQGKRESDGEGKERESVSGEAYGDLQSAIPIIKEHLKSLQNLQHEAVEAMFNDETDTSSSISARIYSSGQKYAKDLFVVETTIKTTTKIPFMKVGD